MPIKRKNKLRFKTVFSDTKVHPYKQVNWDDYGHSRGKDLRDRIDRVVKKCVKTGDELEYFATQKDRDIFGRELTWLILNQKLALEPIVWSTAGADGPQKVSIDSIISVEDTLESKFECLSNLVCILDSGANVGINLSKISGSKENRSTNSVVGLLKIMNKLIGQHSGEKMFILDVDHPEILEFINCSYEILSENTSFAVRVSDDFMKAAEVDTEFSLRSRKTGEVIETISAKDLLQKIAIANSHKNNISIQFDTTINSWHTMALSGKNTAISSGGFVSIDNTQCPRAALDLLRFFDGKKFNFEKFISAVELTVVYLNILVSLGDFATPHIGDQTKKFRPIGISFTNLAALLENLNLKPDSKAAKSLSGAIASLMSATAYRCSAETSAAVGSNTVAKKHHANQLQIVKKHYKASMLLTDTIVDDSKMPININEIIFAANLEWDIALEFGEKHGWYNCQVSLLSPDEDFIFEKINVRNTASPENQVGLLSAIQPYITGGIGQTIKIPKNISVSRIEKIYKIAWKSGQKTVRFAKNELQ